MFALWLVTAGVARYCALIVAKAANKTISYKRLKYIQNFVIHKQFENNVRWDDFQKKKVEKGQIWGICAKLNETFQIKVYFFSCDTNFEPNAHFIQIITWINEEAQIFSMW